MLDLIVSGGIAVMPEGAAAVDIGTGQDTANFHPLGPRGAWRALGRGGKRSLREIHVSALGLFKIFNLALLFRMCGPELCKLRFVSSELQHLHAWICAS